MKRRDASLVRGQRRDSGFVAVMVALLLPVFVGLAALSVDIGLWYVEKADQQKAADAAALAGAKYLPGDPATALAQAQAFATSNGYEQGASIDGHPVTVKVQRLIKASQIRVTISRDVTNTFGALIGVGTTRITATGVADYLGPVPMGSPANRFGNEPLEPGETSQDSSRSGDTANLWANIAGPQSPKVNGDAAQAGSCTTEDGCTSGQNLDYSANGYFYVVRVRGNQPRLKIDVFDPAMIHVGDTCSASQKGSTGQDGHAPRFAGACTGDQEFASGGTPRGTFPTTYVVRGPMDDDPDPLRHPVLASHQFAGAATPSADTTGTWHRWATILDITNPEPGDYYVQVRTNVALGADPVGVPTNNAGSGHNRFSIRATAGSTSANDNLSVFGSGRMGMYVNIGSGTTTFDIARIPSAAAGGVLALRFFDIGDADSFGFQVLRPTDSSTDFTNCVASGVVTGTLANCSTSARANGKWLQVQIPIPAEYRCSDTDPSGCWVRIKINYSGASDTTTWTAALEGDPLRLVE